MKEGWLCPKCGRVNAPFVAECPCFREHVIQKIAPRMSYPQLDHDETLLQFQKTLDRRENNVGTD